MERQDVYTQDTGIAFGDNEREKRNTYIVHSRTKREKEKKKDLIMLQINVPEINQKRGRGKINQH